MTTLKAVASSITTEVDKLAKYIEQNDLPDPSFAADAPAHFSIPAGEIELQASRLSLLKAAEDMAALALGPVESLRWRAWDQNNANLSLQALMRFKVLAAIPLVSKPTPFTTIAERTSLPLPLVTRLLRYAMLSHVLHEPIPHHAAHTAASVSLLNNVSNVRDWLDVTLEEMGHASVDAVSAMQKWPGSQNTRETGFGLAFGGQTRFEYLGAKGNEERAAVFGRAMGNLSKNESYNLEHLVKGYDWQRLGKGKIVDVGGSLGHVSMKIADSVPDLSFIVQDLPSTAASGDKMLPAEYRSRISFQAYDMNNVQPVKDGSLYLFRSIFHDWPDAYVIKFLRNLTPALSPGARVVINELCLPEPGEVNAFDERLIRGLDLCMLAMFNSKERTVEEWKGLLTSASKGLKFLGAKRPGGLLWIVEAEWVGEPIKINGHSEGVSNGYH